MHTCNTQKKKTVNTWKNIVAVNMNYGESGGEKGCSLV